MSTDRWLPPAAIIMQFTTVIFAAGWIEWAGPFVVFILYAIGQFVMNQGKKPPPQRPAQKPRPAAPAQQPRTLEEKLRSEVEDFLRQVQGEQPKQQPQQRPVVVSPRTIVAKVEQPVQTVIELEPERVSLREHLARSMSTTDVTENAATLGSEMGQTDERFQAQLQGRFQHQIGSLEPRQEQRTESPRRRSIAATEIANLLRSPQGMRQVIVASEILRRPEF
jgi:hypothetical protein